MRDTDSVQPHADRGEDALRELFAPISTPSDPSDTQVRAVRADARRQGPVADGRRGIATVAGAGRPARRLAVAGAGGLAVVATAAGVVTAVDRGRPGTFVGEADAQQVLRAAADATRDDATPDGWRLTTTIRNDRGAYEGRRCGTCAVERGVLENRRITRTWNGPGGETYTSVDFEPSRAVENDALLRRVGIVGRRLMPGGAVHRPAAAGPVPDAPALDHLLGNRRTLADPTAVPDEPGALLRWVGERRQERERRSSAARAMRRAGNPNPVIDDDTELSWDLVDLATSTQLNGRQQAAAFDALSTRPGVSVVPTSAALAAPDRVTVRIAAVRGTGADVPDPTELDRFVVFDTGTHGVVGEFTPADVDGPSSAPALTGEDGARVRQQHGSAGSETVYGAPVSVTGPGLDGDGARLLDLSEARDIDLGRDRDGEGR